MGAESWGLSPGPSAMEARPPSTPAAASAAPLPREGRDGAASRQEAQERASSVRFKLESIEVKKNVPSQPERRQSSKENS